MDEELLINVSGFETRVALIQNHVLAEVHLQRSGPYSLTGNIYKGRVERILPGMQAAFVNIGLGRPGFLHARDIDAPRISVAEPDPVQKDIRDLVHEGQALLVQVAKDPIATKGARLTTNIALASRYLVLMPLNAHVGISQRIEDAAERERLRLATETARTALGLPEGLVAAESLHGLNYMVASRAEQSARQGEQLVVSSHRLNLLVALCLPATAFASVLGMNVRHGLENQDTWVFWVVLAVAVVMGVIIFAMVAAPIKTKK